MFGLIGTALGIGADLLSGGKDRETQREINQGNLVAQKEFAQQGIRWKVKDATAAGLHPLAALGAQTHSFNPSSVFTPSPKVGRQITQAFNTMQGREFKNLALQEKRQDIRYKTAMADRAERDLNDMGIGKADQVKALPQSERYILGGHPSGQGDLVKVMPDEVIYHKGGVKPSVKGYSDMYERPDGVINIMPNDQLAEVLESSLPDWINNIIYQTKERGASLAGIPTKAKEHIMSLIPRKPGYKVVWSRGWGSPRYVKWHKKPRFNKREQIERYKRSNRSRRKIINNLRGWDHMRDYNNRP